MRPSSHRWLRQAEADLQAARDSARSSHFEWVCFQSQQSAEKAIKALLDHLRRGVPKGREGHKIPNLIRQVGTDASELSDLSEEAKFLDTVYSRARYQDALESDLTPAEYYDQRAFQADAFSDAFQTTAVDAQKCLSYAESILTAVKRYFTSSTGP